jgi:hypothetical protein
MIVWFKFSANYGHKDGGGGGEYNYTLIFSLCHKFELIRLSGNLKSLKQITFLNIHNFYEFGREFLTFLDCLCMNNKRPMGHIAHLSIVAPPNPEGHDLNKL